MRVELLVLVLLGVAPEAPAATPAPDGAEDPAASTPSEIEGQEAFAEVSAVLTHPRCMNCHPAGDAPLQYDLARPHGMGISRVSPDLGLPCTTCHPATGLGLPNTPPAAPHWRLPPRNQVFQGMGPAALCAQLKHPESTGGRDLDALLEHVSHDALVIGGWDSGGGRSIPPISHKVFVERFATWVAAGAPCPE